MISDIVVKDNLYNFIKGSDLANAVTGVLSKTKRPKNSDKEDIVISVISNMSGQIQEIYANVNIYVKDLSITKNGVTQNEMNVTRCRELCGLAFELLEVGSGEDFRFVTESQRVIAVDDIQHHVINNRILYKQVNDN